MPHQARFQSNSLYLALFCMCMTLGGCKLGQEAENQTRADERSENFKILTHLVADNQTAVKALGKPITFRASEVLWSTNSSSELQTASGNVVWERVTSHGGPIGKSKYAMVVDADGPKQSGEIRLVAVLQDKRWYPERLEMVAKSDKAVAVKTEQMDTHDSLNLLSAAERTVPLPAAFGPNK